MAVLSYGRDSRIRRLRRTLIAIGVLLLLPVGFRPAARGIELAREARIYFSRVSQRRSAETECMAYTPSPATVVFDEAPLRAGENLLVNNASYGLILDPTNSNDTPAQRQIRDGIFAALFGSAAEPKCFASFFPYIDHVRCAPGLRQIPEYRIERQLPRLVFLHSRRAPGRPRRLVSVQFDVVAFDWKRRPAFVVCTYADGGFRRSLVKWCGKLDCLRRGSRVLKLYAGQADRMDDSRFTIRYEAGGISGVLDGRMLADDQVTLERHGANVDVK